MNLASFASFAKINLGLLLLGKRIDGYHDIATVFQQIDLCDKMLFRKTASSIRIISPDSSLPQDEQNLAYQAFTCFQDRFRIQGGIEIHIRKAIPIGAGLGGGSSNAATTLLALNELWNTQKSISDLEELAEEIGSDVPFFLRGGTALGLGRGEILESMELPTGWWIVLVHPGIEVSTGWAYSRAKITLTNKEKLGKLRSIFRQFPSRTLKAHLENELEGVVFKRHPVLRDIKEQMYKREAFYASMSGSGSSVYGLFSHRKNAETAKTFFSMQPDLKAFLCRPIPSPPDREHHLE